ncbi:MAG: cytochrome C [Fluviicola sp.]|nr:MAG: cytochrome C [Fluviicola sp.]
MAKGKRKSIVKYILIVLLVVFGIMQFFTINKTNPKVEEAKDLIAITTPPADIEKMIRTACYDCHSFETKYPWYSNVAPVSWFLGDHIEEGREHLNFSVWGTYDEDKANHKLHECEEEVEHKEMPLDSYTWTHGDAKLSDDQREKLAEWFKSKMTGPDKGHHHEEHEHEH